MKYLMYSLGDDNTPVPPPTPQMMEEMGKFMAEATQKGALLATGGLDSTAKGTTVRYSNGKFTVTDGPYTESKEIIGGWALIEAKSKEEALDWAKRFLKISGVGESRIRQVFGPEDRMPSGR